MKIYNLYKLLLKINKLSHKNCLKGHNILVLLNDLIAMQLERITTFHAISKG